MALFMFHFFLLLKVNKLQEFRHHFVLDATAPEEKEESIGSIQPPPQPPQKKTQNNKNTRGVQPKHLTPEKTMKASECASAMVHTIQSETMISKHSRN